MRGSPAAALLVLGSLLFSGCVVIADAPLQDRTGFRLRWEPSMFPSFEGNDTTTYPFVAVHWHVGESAQEAEEYRTGKRARFVCLTLGGAELASFPMEPAMMADAAACMMPYDGGLGRLYVSSEEFERWDPWAVAALGRCATLVPLGKDSPGFQVEVPRGPFRIEFLANESLRINDWTLAPGHALKIDYWDLGEDAKKAADDRPVTLVIDYAGRWLRERVGMPVDPPLPPPPEGDGLEAWVPRQPQRIHELLHPLTASAPSVPAHLLLLRLTIVDGNVTDLRAVLEGDEVVEWFVAGGSEDSVRLLGRRTESGGLGRVGFGAFVQAFNATPLSQFSGPVSDSAGVEFSLEPSRSLRSTSPVQWSETWIPPTSDCGAECPFVWAKGPDGSFAWRRADLSQAAEGSGALTLQVRIEDLGNERERLFFHP